MSQFILPTTELEAINAMLRSIGESPLDSPNQTFADADIARQVLLEELRAVQNHQWVWNTELYVELLPAPGNNRITLPQNTLRVISDPRYVQRGTLLYDRYNNTYTIPHAVTCHLVIALGFEEVPEAVRRYVFVKAARRFQDALQPDAATHSFNERDELRAWTSLLNYESQVAQWNVLDNLALNHRLKRYRPNAGTSLRTVPRD